ncbi:alpha/beta hydrolase [Streptomyces sp. SID14515]|uniref:alpha/beta hydrolase n=1 Tax=Streptomyces sp. SID14515 TaxID=2706074 RepID=UPI0013CC81D1|nr:alpha/beta hydrolase [Streptomyces sp. SID14515]NEB42671.1 alpha/beta fold hydrolase [Streptomyces sp. SID14515]
MTLAPSARRARRVPGALSLTLSLSLVGPLALPGAVATATAQPVPQRWTQQVGSALLKHSPSRKETPVNACVPKRLHGKAVSFTAADGVRLSGLVLGSGPRGVVLSHENGWDICSWLAFAEELAAAGYQVIVYDQRNVPGGASERGGRADNLHFDRDVRAAVQQLRDRGVTRILAGGASMGGTATATAAPEIPGLVGLLILSSPRELPVMKPLPGLAAVTVPSFFAAATGDQTFVDEVRALYKASGAKDKQIRILDSHVHGVDMMEDGAAGARLHDQVLAFVDGAFRKSGASAPAVPPADHSATPPSEPTGSPATHAADEPHTPRAANRTGEEADRLLPLGIGAACALLTAAAVWTARTRLRGRGVRRRR